MTSEEAAHLARWQVLERRSSAAAANLSTPSPVLLNCLLVNIRTEPNSIDDTAVCVLLLAVCVRLKIFALRLKGSSIVYLFCI